MRSQRVVNHTRKLRDWWLLVLPVVLAPALIVLPGCAGKSFKGSDGRPLVVTSITPIGSIIRNVAGDRAQVETLVPSGGTAYGYRLSDSDHELLERSSIAIFNGMGYDDTLMAEVSNTAQGAYPVIEFGTLLITAEASVAVTPAIAPALPQSPFVWLDPLASRAFAAITRDALIRIDPGSTTAYRENFDRFVASVERINSAISDTISTIPIGSRSVYSQVDVLDHYSARFGLISLGGSRSFNSPPPDAPAAASIGRSLAPLSLPAIFSTAPTTAPSFDEIARLSRVQMVVMVRFEDLPGPPGSLSHTYFGLLIENTRLIAQALGGSSDPLGGIRPNDTAPISP